MASVSFRTYRPSAKAMVSPDCAEPSIDPSDATWSGVTVIVRPVGAGSARQDPPRLVIATGTAGVGSTGAGGCVGSGVGSGLGCGAGGGSAGGVDGCDVASNTADTSDERGPTSCLSAYAATAK